MLAWATNNKQTSFSQTLKDYVHTYVPIYMYTQGMCTYTLTTFIWERKERASGSYSKEEERPRLKQQLSIRRSSCSWKKWSKVKMASEAERSHKRTTSPSLILNPITRLGGASENIVCECISVNTKGRILQSK